MSSSQIAGIGSLPSALGRIAGSSGSEYDRPDSRVAGLFRSGTPRVSVDETRVVERISRSKARPDASQKILSAHQFEYFLERERSLADRGTRRFSLLVLCRTKTHRGRRGPDALAALARILCKRLRSTDLVGRLDADRVEILLADTEPVGAQVVAVWVEEAQAKLGLDLERTIYVYPSVAEPSSGRDHDRGPHDGGLRESARSNEPLNGQWNRRKDGAAYAPVEAGAQGKEASNGKASHGHLNGNLERKLNGHALHVTPETALRTEAVVPVGRWSMKDLWPHLGVPTPLWKRALDIFLSVFALLVLSPLYALIALAIRLDSPGPVIFKQLRAGRGGRAFVFYKFRSMSVDAEERRAALAARNEQDGPIFKIHDDPRTTRVGRWLRRWSIDELPQLWNVLKGDISLVGPRSPTFDEVSKYERWQRRRLSVTGGITCIWQVSGRSQIPFRDWMRLDMRYVACRNLWLDLRLLVLTLPAVISGRGAC